ncbi:MAG: flagellar basal body-associated protein FliL [Candidatus Competibacteraceae bacterium]|nr:MAG: flagellar basal body-associated protein FliL [Candidatus Competibacteraceae bacterium]
MAQKDDAKPAAGSGTKKILFLSLGILVLIGGSIGATLFLTGALNPPAAAANPEMDHANPGRPAPRISRQPALYQPIDPPFLVNYEDQGMLRYLQVGITVMARDQIVIDATLLNMPQIRNDLIMLFADQKQETLVSREGKEELRLQAMEQIQAILNREIGHPGIETLYFTTFVMQ